jgi:hypothetical protein
VESVRGWAERRGASYSCLDDEEFFADVPPWLFELEWMQPATDLARLLAARRLHERHRCSIWIDADVLVFEPRRLQLPLPRGDAAFAREVWLRRNRKGRFFCREQVANYACSFKRGSRTLEEYIESCFEAPVSAVADDRCFLGPTYLGARHSLEPLELIEHIGTLSPRVIHALTRRDMPVLDTYRRALGNGIYAANLCLSFEGRRVNGQSQSAVVADLVENGGRLFETRRSLLGRWWRKPNGFEQKATD